MSAYINHHGTQMNACITRIHGFSHFTHTHRYGENIMHILALVRVQHSKETEMNIHLFLYHIVILYVRISVIWYMCMFIVKCMKQSFDTHEWDDKCILPSVWMHTWTIMAHKWMHASRGNIWMNMSFHKSSLSECTCVCPYVLNRIVYVLSLHLLNIYTRVWKKYMIL